MKRKSEHMKVFGYELSTPQLSAYLSFLVAAPASAVFVFFSLSDGEASITPGMAAVAVLVFVLSVAYLPRFIDRNLDKDAKFQTGRSWRQRF
jgi:hypothetical protein